MLEWISRNSVQDVSVFHQLNNWMVFFIVYFSFLLLCNSVKRAAQIGNLFFLMWSLANRYIYLFKGQILQPIDLRSVVTAFHVASEYDYTPTVQMVCGIIVFFFLFSIWESVQDRKIIYKKDWKK
ncbi:MAG: hypothetical protein Q4B70_17425, partial [Lachnospiraceae bacterium]|nr:hypothetical protein [Lachnospiraceae bacterium]